MLALPRGPPVLSIRADLESNSLRSSSVHSLWGSITLKADTSFTGTPLGRPPTIPVDFVVAIDVSASMRVDDKLLYVQATIRYLLSHLDETHTFSLIAFNHDVLVLTELLPCTDENKKQIQTIVDSLQAQGSTNISEALVAATRVLAKRKPGISSSRVSSIMLFTDGLCPHGSSSANPVDKIRIPAGCVFNTFGFGAEHDSQFLHSIAHRAQGVYYFVETREQIAPTFSECLAALLNTRAHQITVSFKCHDGARLVTLATPFKIEECQVAKEYNVNLELMYQQESKTILFKLSLRKLTNPTQAHRLLSVEVDYLNALTGKRERVCAAPIYVCRPDQNLLATRPLALDEHLNRYNAATAIARAIEYAGKFQFAQASSKLEEAIEEISKSLSRESKFCQDLLSDLAECQLHLADAKALKNGLHVAHAFVSMYFMERSSGLASRQGLRSTRMRHLGYGYITPEQETLQNGAVSSCNPYTSAYHTTICY